MSRGTHQASAKQTETGRTNRGITSNVLRDTSSFSDVIVEDVAKDARGSGLFGVGAGSAGEFERLELRVFSWVEHVGALAAEAEGDLLEVLLLLIAAMARRW